MDNTIRIKTTPNGDDSYLKLNIEQDFDFIEILSLKISQEEAYTRFCSDYGTIVGRVTVNNGFGVPNAKVSVFIPLDETDKTNPEIKNIYPYEVITDKTSEGIRYNLLPKDTVPDNDCFTPIGTFPNKREVLDNPTMLEVYCKYYKFTTTTNHAGDFMIFGVPVGTYTVHLDADISDIGIISQRPYDLINQGTPEKMFDSPTKFKSSKNLDKLIQIKTFNTGVNVQPFWGDTENCEIGITRLDMPLNYTVIPSAIFTGSIFGDQDKQSVNKRCRPRNKLGKLCEQITGEGSIEMIRKTIDNDIERFDIDGGRVIDENGAWSYQIPMNLDYMVTDELGNLIYSQDPNIGIPTRTSVRFRIGMDETGGEGRLRTRGKFLVPNNPSTQSEIDYNFGPTSNNGPATMDSSFKDLYWNKIYTVSNFIARYQTNSLTSARAMTAIKDVDACVGDKTPFPYNRVNTEVNPMFSIICVIMVILSTIIILINAVIITVVNFMIWVIRMIISFINTLITVVNWFGLTIPTIPEPQYAKCISIVCPSEEPNMAYAPGCLDFGGEPIDSGYTELKNEYGNVDTSNESMLKCLAFQMAKSMGLFQYEFYNDWINGSLFGFLLKYKKKRKQNGRPGREKFCEYDCGDFTADPNYTGVDSNNNGTPDNDCHTQYLVDSCFSGSILDYDAQDKGYSTGGLREGIIKNVNGELYYAASTHNVGYKLFATDIMCLGSVFECDWQGIPKVNDLLIPTTYKLPPDVSDISDDGIFEATGVVDLNDTHGGLFFNVDCIGIHVDSEGCLNIRHICEFGVNIDEISYDSAGSVLTPDGNIGSIDIDDDSGKWFRDVFFELNKNTTSPISFSLPSGGSTTNFNTGNLGMYDFSSPNDNGNDYLSFRNFTNGSNDYGQTRHSYFFYFGLLPGKTSLDKMNTKYFTKCIVPKRDSFIIQSTATPTGSNTQIGTITFIFLGGLAPITYTVIGPNYSINGSVQSNTSTLISGLGVGTYSIQGTDSLGTIISRDIVVSGPAPLTAYAFVSKNASTISSNDGEITINNINNGVQPYTYVLKDASGAIIKGPLPATPSVITGIPFQDPIGYTLEITDNVGTMVSVNNLIVTGLPILNGVITKTDTTCYGGTDGKLLITPQGGKPPYSFSTTGPNSFSATTSNLISLVTGTYTTIITDSLSTPQTVTITTNINSVNPEMILTFGSTSELNKQCNFDKYLITVYLSYSFGATTTANLQYLSISGQWVDVVLPYVNSTTPLIFAVDKTLVPANIKIRSKYGTIICYSNQLSIPTSVIVTPTIDLDGTIVTTINTSSPLYTHTISSIGGIGTVIGNPYNITIINDNNPSITTTLTDSVGCTKTIQG
jgi:hypothetical protein